MGVARQEGIKLVHAVNVREPIRADEQLQHSDRRGDRLGSGSFYPSKDRICQIAIFRVAFYMENEDARIEAYLAVPPEKRLQFFYCQDSLSVLR